MPLHAYKTPSKVLVLDLRGGGHDHFRVSYYLTSNTHRTSIFHPKHPILIPKCFSRLFQTILENLKFLKLKRFIPFLKNCCRFFGPKQYIIRFPSKSEKLESKRVPLIKHCRVASSSLIKILMIFFIAILLFR